MFTLGIFLAAATINTAAELARATERYEPGGRNFDIIVRITQTQYMPRGVFYAEDETGAIELNTFPGDWRKMRPGDVYRLRGHTNRLAKRLGVIHADCDEAELIKHEEVPVPKAVSAHDLIAGKFLFEHVSVNGIMSGVFRDEIDPTYIYFIVACGDERVFAVLLTEADAEELSRRLLGARVTVTGCCSRDADSRSFCDYFLSLNSLESINVRERLHDDPFSARDISDTANLTPQAVSILGRRLATGTVLAAWSRNKVLLKTAKSGPLFATLAGGDLPKPDTMIEVSGYPETDLYSINLSRAVWRPSSAAPMPLGEPTTSSPSRLTSDEMGRPRIDASMHSRRVVMEGEAKRIRRGRNDEFMFSLEDGPASVDVIVTDEQEASSIEEGCRVAVTGVCVMEKELWRPNSIIPRITDVYLVVNGRGNVRIVSRPPWWTPLRLLYVIAALAVALLGIFLWNITLRTLVVRRTRQLLKAETSKIDAHLRIDERTRLAAELHDSLAQTLSGVSLQVDAAKVLVDGDRDGLAKRLGLVSDSLNSCRAELRNCLWDLRNQALDEPDMEAAIRQTLAPLVGDVNLSVRFKARRSHVSDNTAHAVLRIVRELVSNAIRHGMAKNVRIAGGLEDGSIRFSVWDDGCGFNPDSVPGVRQGHFGLTGIRERVRKLNGTIQIESAPGRGAKFTVSLEGAKAEKS